MVSSRKGDQSTHVDCRYTKKHQTVPVSFTFIHLDQKEISSHFTFFMGLILALG